MKKLFFVALLIGAFSKANAAPIKWELVGFQFNDGGAAYGSFIYDSNTNLLSDIDIYTSSGSVLSGRHYVSTAGAWGDMPQIGVLAFSDTTGPDFTGAGYFRIQANIDFNASPGAVVNQWLAVGGESFCTNFVCNAAANEISHPNQSRETISGHLVAASSVPEPSSLAISAVGLAILVSRITSVRRKTMAFSC